MAKPFRIPMSLYKIFPASADLPVPLPQSLVLPKAPWDGDPEFIHFPRASQVSCVLNQFFAAPDITSVKLVKMSFVRLVIHNGIKWEVAGEDGSRIAHLYDNDITGLVVQDVKVLERGDDWDLNLQALTTEGWLQEDD
ncbi:MAG: hypothetical protein Q9222_006370 [Ikaeria aurantiellina]